MVGGDGRPHRYLPGPAYSQADRKGQSRRHESGFHAAGRVCARPQGFVQAQGIRQTVKGIADTGFLIAFANRSDAYHDWALGVADLVTEPLLTCEAVLAEAAFHLQNLPLVLAMVREGLVTIGFHCDDHMPQLEALASRYAYRHPDLADLCLIRMSELFPKHSIITVDREDFRIYRRNKREVIPIICPPDGQHA